jgi:hypothetical protein
MSRDGRHKGKPTEPENPFENFIPCALWDDMTVQCAKGARYFYRKRDNWEGPNNKTYRCEDHRIDDDDPEWEYISQKELVLLWEINKMMIE